MATMEIEINEGSYTVYANAPFYTGFIIDSSELLEKGYPERQQEILNTLKSQEHSQWAIEGSHDTDFLYEVKEEDTFAGKTFVSPSFIINRPNLELRKFEFEGNNFEVIDALIYFHVYGTAVWHIKLQVNISHKMKKIDFREMVYRFIYGDLKNSIDPFCQLSTQQLIKVLKNQNVRMNSFEGLSDKLKAKGQNFLPLRSILWLHIIFFFEFEGQITDEIRSEYQTFVISSQASGANDCSMNSTDALYPGYGMSLIMVKKDGMYFKGQPRITELANYHYAAIALLDTQMYYDLIQFSAKKRRITQIKNIESELEIINELSENLEVFFLNYKDITLKLAPISKGIWKRLENEWYMVPMREALLEKKNQMQNQYREYIDELSQKRSSALNSLVRIFTVFAIIGPVLEIYQFFSESEGLIASIEKNWVPILIVFIPIVIIISFYVFKYLRKISKF